jgi:hypothetical protein
MPQADAAARVPVRPLTDLPKLHTPDLSGDKPPWPVIAQDAYHGLAGDIVRAIEPHTEADPIAILVQYLCCFGNAIGRGAYYQVEGDKHFANTFWVLTGQSSKGRKGTSWGRVRQVFDAADPEWVSTRIHSGMSSGEGLIWQVRNPTTQWVDNEDGGKERVIDPGISDKRLMIIESEFAGALEQMRRHGNTLSVVTRDAWDRGDLGSMIKNSPARATGAHISIVGHITDSEMRKKLDETSMANGYANRFLFACARRARLLPHGGTSTNRQYANWGNALGLLWMQRRMSATFI